MAFKGKNGNFSIGVVSTTISNNFTKEFGDGNVFLSAVT